MKSSIIKILALGDVVGSSAIDYLASHLWSFRDREDIDLTVANGENATAIHGLSSKDASRLLDTGVDLITLGNHTWGMRDLYPFLDSHPECIIRPANYPPAANGFGYTIVDVCSWRLLAINVLGVVFMEPLASPFETVEKILSREAGNYDLALLDIHAEATSEKLAIAKYFDGKIDLMFGTHTHVRTDDASLLPRGSAYITDLGMCGPTDGILGTNADAVIGKFLTHQPAHFTVAEGPVRASGVIFEYDTAQNKPVAIRKIEF